MSEVEQPRSGGASYSLIVASIGCYPAASVGATFDANPLFRAQIAACVRFVASTLRNKLFM